MSNARPMSDDEYFAHVARMHAEDEAARRREDRRLNRNLIIIGLLVATTVLLAVIWVGPR